MGQDSQGSMCSIRVCKGCFVRVMHLKTHISQRKGMYVLRKENPPLGNTGSLYVLLRVWEKAHRPLWLGVMDWAPPLKLWCHRLVWSHEVLFGFYVTVLKAVSWLCSSLRKSLGGSLCAGSCCRCFCITPAECPCSRSLGRQQGLWELHPPRVSCCAQLTLLQLLPCSLFHYHTTQAGPGRAFPYGCNKSTSLLGIDGSACATVPLSTFSVSLVQLNKGSWSVKIFSHNQKNEEKKQSKQKWNVTRLMQIGI